jgi:hypothetical protein
MASLAALTRLRSLSVLPLGIEVTGAGLAALAAGLTSLAQLRAGFTQGQQVEALQGLADRYGWRVWQQTFAWN